MRRSALSTLVIVSAGLLSGCTGTGVFFDHTTQWFGHVPNAPAGSSETFLRIRGEQVDVPALVPEKGNVWPENVKPDMTLQDIQKQQDAEIRRNGGQPGGGAGGSGGAGGAGTGATNGPNPGINRANQADRGLPPPQTPPPAPRQRSSVPTPNGPSLDVGGGSGRGYNQLNPPANAPGSAASPGGGGILVPNGNGTSTLIGPDGSVRTVPTK